jgi:hypothetical protein
MRPGSLTMFAGLNAAASESKSTTHRATGRRGYGVNGGKLVASFPQSDGAE